MVTEDDLPDRGVYSSGSQPIPGESLSKVALKRPAEKPVNSPAKVKKSPAISDYDGEISIGTRRVSGRQLDILCEYLSSHREIAVAYNRSLQAKEYASKKWKEVSKLLNFQGEGAYKDWKGWSKYWVDYKAKLKKRVAALRRSHSRIGGGPSTEQPLADIEEKFLQILGEDFGQGLVGVQVDPFPQPCGTAAAEGEWPVIQIPLIYNHSVESPSSESTLRSNDPFLDPILVSGQNPDSAPEASLPADRASPINSTLPSSPLPSVAGPSPQRRRSRREILMTNEAARRARARHVTERKVRAAERSSRILEGIGHTLVEICNTLQRIERSINTSVPRAAE